MPKQKKTRLKLSTLDLRHQPPASPALFSIFYVPALFSLIPIPTPYHPHPSFSLVLADGLPLLIESRDPLEVSAF